MNSLNGETIFIFSTQFIMASNIASKCSKWRAALLAAAGIIFGGIAAYYAISGEITGKTHALNMQVRYFHFLPVTREDAPEDFRHANNIFWGMSIFSFGIGAAAIWHFRDLKDCD